ncbi:MAG: alginate export family protein [Gammaproteobacteria bacterium]|nr:alginate export family protein [Gammaproteobacteria bacterium]
MKYLIGIFALFFISQISNITAAELQLTGSMRTRFETLDGQYRARGSQSDQQITTRAILKAEYNFTSVDLVAEVINANVFLTDKDSTLNNSMANAFEPLQAYIALRPDSETQLTMGRYTLDLGSRRLIGRNEFRNTSNTFLGILLERNFHEASRLTLFYNSPAVLRPASREGLENHKRKLDEHSSALRFWGLHVEKLGSQKGLMEAYFYGLDERDSSNRATPDRQLKTIGFRYQSPYRNNWRFGGELIYQWGTRQADSSLLDVASLDVSAGVIHLETAYRLSEGQQIRFAFDVASGDRSNQDWKYNRFDALYGPTVPDFGFVGLYGAVSRANLVSPEVRWTHSADDWNLLVAYRPMWLASKTDSFGRSGIRDVDGGSGRFAGQQLHARLRLNPNSSRWNSEFGLALLRAEEFLQKAPTSTGNKYTVYTYGSFSYRF